MSEKIERVQVARLKDFIRRIPAHTKHGPQGRGGEGPCSPDCVKCEAEEMLKSF